MDGDNNSGTGNKMGYIRFDLPEDMKQWAVKAAHHQYIPLAEYMRRLIQADRDAHGDNMKWD